MPKTTKLSDDFVTRDELLQPPVSPVNIDEHQAHMARLKAELEEKRDVLDACLDPAVAKWHEDQKPQYLFRVKAQWKEPNSEGRRVPHEIDVKVTAQNAADAWAEVCDSVQSWPSFRHVKPSIEQIKKMPTGPSGPPPEAEEAEVVRLVPKKRRTVRL